MSRFNSTRDTSIISGSDSSMTAHAYTEMSNPARASVTPKSRAMSLNKPMGMNSEVLNMNAAHANPTSASLSLPDKRALPGTACPA